MANFHYHFTSLSSNHYHLIITLYEISFLFFFLYTFYYYLINCIPATVFLLSVLPWILLLSSPSFPYRNDQDSQKYEANMVYQVARKLGTSTHIKAEQGNLVGRKKKSKEHIKGSEAISTPTVRSSTRKTSYVIISEGLCQYHAGTLIVG